MMEEGGVLDLFIGSKLAVYLRRIGKEKMCLHSMMSNVARCN
jgi:hypothetical protein